MMTIEQYRQRSVRTQKSYRRELRSDPAKADISDMAADILLIRQLDEGHKISDSVAAAVEKYPDIDLGDAIEMTFQEYI